MIGGFVFALLLVALVSAMQYWLYQKKLRQSEEKSSQLSSQDSFFHEQYNELISDFGNMLSERIEQERFNIQKHNARIIQSKLNLMQAQCPEGISVNGSITSADECSGDWWYCYTKENKLFVWIGDVTGHGVASAIVASACRGVVGSFENSPCLDILKQTYTLNKVITKMFQGTSYVTFRCIEIDLETLVCHCVNGSHPDMFVGGKEGFQLEDKLTGPPLGMKMDARFTSKDIQLEENFKILLFTDGFLEFKRLPKKRWSLLRIARFLDALASSPEKDLLEEIEAKIKEIRDPEASVIDDITLVCIEHGKVASTQKKAS